MSYQKQKATGLKTQADIEIPKGAVGIPELKKFQAYLKEYVFTVYSYDSKARDVTFYSGVEGKKLNLLH